MQLSKPAQARTQDYVGAYEKAIRDVVSACGSRSAANMLLDDLHAHYERTGVELERVKKLHGEDPQRHAAHRAAVLERARQGAHVIIEGHLPHTRHQLEELIIGTSLAVTAVMMPVAHLPAAFAAAVGIAAVGGSYYVGYKFLRDWKLIAGKHRVARMSGHVSPRHISNLPKIIALAGKKR